MSTKSDDQMLTKASQGPRFARSDIRYWQMAVFQRVRRRKGKEDKSKHFSIQLQFAGRREELNLRTANRAAAAGRAREIYDHLKVNGWAENEQRFRKAWVTTLVIDESSLRAVRVQVTEEALAVDLVDGQSLSIPLVWYPRLLQASVEERRQFRPIGGGEVIHWDLLNEDISVERIVAGRRSMESAESFRRWLKDRKERDPVR